MRICRIIIFACLATWPALAPAHSSDRVALVIGNGAYEHTSPLNNTIRDAAAMAEVLTQMGYEVSQINNTTQAQMHAALIAFTNQAMRAHTAVIFYSGHGMELNGDNYVIPVDAGLSGEGIGRLESVKLDLLREAAGAASNLSVVILDACRSNVFPSSNKSGARGLIPVHSTPGEVVAFSTAPGKVAADGDGDLSPYTAVLTARLWDNPHQDVRVLFSSLELEGMDQIPDMVAGQMSAGLMALADPPPVDPCAVYGNLPAGVICEDGEIHLVIAPAPEVSVAGPSAVRPNAQLTLTPVQIAQRDYACVLEDGGAGVSFAEQCWSLDTTSINWADIPNGVHSLITDIAPLAGLTGLEKLFLDNTQVSDIAPLANLTGLRVLWLSSTPVSDVAPLANLTGLERLRLNGTQVSDLTPLADLTGLRTFYLSETQVSDLRPLSGLMGLRELDLSDTQVTNLKTLSGLRGLRGLWLSNTPVSDVAPLSSLTRLQWLRLERTQVSDLSPLFELSQLTFSGPDGQIFNVYAASDAIRSWRPAP